MYEELIEGLKIFSKYKSGGLAAEHDVLLAGPDIKDVSEEDAKKLDKLGWLIFNEYDSWGTFV